MSNTPLVSVLMPVYNAGSYFKPALVSIINQTYTNWELIIADDGCTDGCLEILTAINDPRIIVIRDSMNLGISKRLNQMIGMARGQYFARMDSDDIAHTDRLREQLCMLLENPQLDLIASRANIINNNVVVGELPFKLTHNEICAKPWFGFYMAHPTW
ncbi:MAG: glycosyltransferase family 2 protein, partial [Nitrososphaeraceae archaeon]